LPTPTNDDYQLNKLLSVLSSPLLKLNTPDFERVDLPFQMTLIDLDEDVGQVYFPLSGVVSLVAIMSDGSSGEVGIIGNEGMVGLAAFLGGGSMPMRAIVQVAGDAMRTPARSFREYLSDDGILPRVSTGTRRRC
jgi:CRP-like cAMP-binding protein